ncbi:hypothetical protein Tco_0065154 [Tanacetum coccineum]
MSGYGEAVEQGGSGTGVVRWHYEYWLRRQRYRRGLGSNFACGSHAQYVCGWEINSRAGIRKTGSILGVTMSGEAQRDECSWYRSGMCARGIMRHDINEGGSVEDPWWRGLLRQMIALTNNVGIAVLCWEWVYGKRNNDVLGRIEREYGGMYIDVVVHEDRTQVNRESRGSLGWCWRSLFSTVRRFIGVCVEEYGFMVSAGHGEQRGLHTVLVGEDTWDRRCGGMVDGGYGIMVEGVVVERLCDV